MLKESYLYAVLVYLKYESNLFGALDSLVIVPGALYIANIYSFYSQKFDTNSRILPRISFLKCTEISV